MTWQQSVASALPDGAVVQQSSATQLQPEPRTVGVARRWVAEHVPLLDPDTLDTVLLLTSELVTNAVVHARTEVELAVTLTEDEVVVTVHDLDLGRREHRTHDRDGGRGLAMVDALSGACGLTRHSGGGKTSWFRVARVPARHPGAQRASA